jgi:hypothetical protein
VDKNDSIFGHFFALFPQNKSLASINTESIQTFNNLKKLKNLGEKIESIKLYNTLAQGYVIKYTKGSTCLTDNSNKSLKTAKNYQTYLFISCDKYDEDPVPKLLKSDLNSTFIINLDGCTLVFEWKTQYACRNCLKDESVYKMVHSILYIECMSKCKEECIL